MNRHLVRPVLTTAVLLLGITLFEVWSWQLGRERLAGLPLPGAGQPIDVEITLPFVPEAFNIQRLQQAGRLVKIEGKTMWLRSVPRDELVGLARLYWIGRIRRWNGS